MYIKGSGTYPCTLLSKLCLAVQKHQEEHKCISKDGAFCYGYSGDRLARFFRWASSLFLKICGQVIPHIHYPFS